MTDPFPTMTAVREQHSQRNKTYILVMGRKMVERGVRLEAMSVNENIK